MATDFKKSKRKPHKGNLFFVFAAIIVIIISVALLYANIKMYKKRKELNIQMSALENNVKSLQAKNKNLEQGITESSDSDYIEKVAREQLDLQKPGETVVSFVKPAPTEPSAPTNSNPLESWLGWVSGIFGSIDK